MNEVIVDADKLSVRSGNTFLLNAVSWQVRRGEHWLVFGMNGSGKTTLLSLIAGFHAPTSGRLSVFGEPYTRDRILQQRRRIGWVSASFFDKCYHQEQVFDIVLSGLFGTLGIDFAVTDSDVRRAKHLLRSGRVYAQGDTQDVMTAENLSAVIGEEVALYKDQNDDWRCSLPVGLREEGWL